MLWLLAFACVASELTCVAADPGDDCCQVLQCSMCVQSAISDAPNTLIAVVSTMTEKIATEVTEPDSPDLDRLDPPPNF